MHCIYINILKLVFIGLEIRKVGQRYEGCVNGRTNGIRSAWPVALYFPRGVDYVATHRTSSHTLLYHDNSESTIICVEL